jgi:hypothetical protein
MFISEAEAQRRLNSCKNIANFLNFSGARLNHVHKVPEKIGSAKATSLPENLGCETEKTGNIATRTPELGPISKSGPISEENNNKLKIITRSLQAQGVADSTIAAELNVSRKEINISNASVDNRVRANMERIRDLAMDRMLIALGLMTQDKFDNAPLKELNGSVSALSKVIDQTRIDNVEASLGVQFIVHAPKTKDLKQYNIVDV